MVCNPSASDLITIVTHILVDLDLSAIARTSSAVSTSPPKSTAPIQACFLVRKLLNF
jgi:hypothetical protein